MTLEIALDVTLKLVFTFTLALIAAKALELWAPAPFFPAAPKTAREFGVWLEKKERFLTLLATIVATAPFLGLAGTITHLIKALTAMSGSGADMGLISGPIAQSLYATLWGLASAVPANIFYNLALRRLQIFENRFQRGSGEAKSE